ncbi:hypothetical protein GCM10009745_81490 [Kribbella yunnanensis]|uniref:LPXTG cell wall anchor domain-containing protein n=1 Tax=Kribbella yunnanensis TaxID=190194 RepID=A0ABN2J8L6_9ACTN
MKERATGLAWCAVGMPSRAGAVIVTVLNRVLGVAGVVVLLGGIALGFRSVSSSGTVCGSAFRTAAGITPMTCDSALSSAGTLVTVVIAVGVALLVGAIAVKKISARAGD